MSTPTINPPPNGSSFTRTRPIFQQLIRRDPAGTSWLPKILGLAPAGRRFAELASQPGEILHHLVVSRPHSDARLYTHGIFQLELEHCFEREVAPPMRFLHWAIEHSDRLVWPQDDAGKPLEFAGESQTMRRFITAYGDALHQLTARQQALDQLERVGADGSRNQWWAFEDFSRVECFIETDHMVLLIEGTDGECMRGATPWFPARRSWISHLERAQAAGWKTCKAYGLLLCGEEAPQAIGDVREEMEQGLPHFSPDECDEISRHYLGCITWNELCGATGVAYDRLPRSVGEWADAHRVVG